MKSWKKVRAKGKLRFFFLEAVLKWGALYAIISMLLDLYNLSDRTLDGELPNYPDFSSFCVSLIKGSIVGFILALLMWKENEKEYLLRKDELTRTEDELNK